VDFIPVLSATLRDLLKSLEPSRLEKNKPSIKKAVKQYFDRYKDYEISSKDTSTTLIPFSTQVYILLKKCHL
jgi:hypothetical protein